MSNILTALDRQWVEFAASRRGRRTLARWQTAEPVLAGVPTLDALIYAARDIDGDDLDGRDELHLALLRIAATDEDARCAVLHLLHPALVATARLYSDTWDRDEVASLVVTAALDRIVRYPHGLPRPAASIVRWVRRALWKEAQRHNARHRVLGCTTVLDDAIAIPAESLRSSSDEIVDLIDQALHDGVLSADRARLVLLHRVFSVPTASIAQLEGYPPSTIRQRRSRAEAKLVAASRTVA